jgi:hypothetical protein
MTRTYAVSIHQSSPLRQRQQVPKPGRPLSTKDHLRVEVGRVDLAQELAAPPTGRHHRQRTIFVPPHRDDPGDPVLAGRDHGSDRTVLPQNPVPEPVSMQTPEYRMPRSVTSVAATSPNSRPSTAGRLRTACAASISSSFGVAVMVASYQRYGEVIASTQVPGGALRPPQPGPVLRRAFLVAGGTHRAGLLSDGDDSMLVGRLKG